MVIKNFLNKPTPPAPASVPVPATGGDAQPVLDAHSLPPVTIAPIWPAGSVFDMHALVSTSPYDPFAPQLAVVDKGLPRWVWPGIRFGDWDDQRSEDFVIDVPNVRVLLDCL